MALPVRNSSILPAVFAGLFALCQLPLGLLRRKTAFRKKGLLKSPTAYFGILSIAVGGEIFSALVSPAYGLWGLVLHIIGSRLCVFGITGGIGSGKSTLGKFMRDNGFIVLDCDQISREILVKNHPAHRALVKAFGRSILTESGDIDREKMAALAWSSDPNRGDAVRKKLSAITHPFITNRLMFKLITARLLRFHRWVAIEAPLLFETGMHWLCSPILLVDVTEGTQARRVMERVHTPPERVERQIRSQSSRDEKLRRADVVFDNEGAVNLLYRQCADYFYTEHGLAFR
ncbi:unnamed protein product [Vitrella brassicaformis CCMP3155]|uniref:Dephospho-CoA kinase n=2 Tax=Vitrella brassicaformis TaxID=1169539 RepID=A0A0G4FJM6_VITBC|nr:unnamed protein product [Vitrella brassicaformis CCMP3155]|eukprot:CEM13953.1 unnamed protein product [Vitrella brassicaformis CCMP3155]